MNKRERVYVVDKDDNVLGEKWRDELTDEDCWRVISVWVTDKDNKILLQQRSLKLKIGPGNWSAACEGTIEKGDTPLETALRELEEELGLQVNAADLRQTTKVHYKDPQFGWRIKYGYHLTIEYREAELIHFQKSEVEQVRWYSMTELQKFISKNPTKLPLASEYRKLNFY